MHFVDHLLVSYIVSYGVMKHFPVRCRAQCTVPITLPMLVVSWLVVLIVSCEMNTNTLFFYFFIFYSDCSRLTANALAEMAGRVPAVTQFARPTDGDRAAAKFACVKTQALAIDSTADVLAR